MTNAANSSTSSSPLPPDPSSYTDAYRQAFMQSAAFSLLTAAEQAEFKNTATSLARCYQLENEAKKREANKIPVFNGQPGDPPPVSGTPAS